MRRGVLFTCISVAIFCQSEAGAQDLVRNLSLDEAISLAQRENPTLRAAQFDLQSTRANEITAGLYPNPTFSYAAEQLGEPEKNKEQYTVIVGQTIETGG